MKKLLALLLAIAMIFCVAGCTEAESQESSAEVEVIVETETIIEKDETEKDDDIVSNESIVSSEVTEQNSSVETPVSSEEPSTSSNEVFTPAVDEKVNIDYEWKSHPEDYKLLAFTFDDGPSARMADYVNLFAAFEGAGTFFVNGRNFKSSYEYGMAQNAIDYGWDIGNHGENHLVDAPVDGPKATYDALKADIDALTNRLQTNLKKRDGSPYEVAIYRPPNIKPSADTFKICAEKNFPVIWLQYDALDWDVTKTDNDRENIFKYGVGTWEDGDVILCHEVQEYADQTYKYLEKYLPEFYRKGYRFCSVTELMELRGITREQISGELNNVDGNRGMVRNIVKAAEQGKK